MTSSPDAEQVVLRHAARVVLIDARDRVLLMRWRLRSGDHVWITPGGGLDAGEDHREAAGRELEEEIGLAGAVLGPCVWMREHTFPWQERTFRQRERFYLLRVRSHEVDRSGNDASELEVIEEFRWWSQAELDASVETFSPRRIAYFLRALLEEALPTHPVDVGV